MFRWCDGVGVDINIDSDIEYCRSRVLMDYDGEVGYDSCSVVSYIKDEDDDCFVEMMIKYSLYEYFMKVYDVVFIIDEL